MPYVNEELMFRELFSRNVKRYMQRDGIGQKELASRSHLSQSAISKLLNGLATPTVRSAVNIALALDVEVDKLIYF